MPTDDEQLRFAVAFAQRDLNQLRPGDWLNLRDDFRKFLIFCKADPPIPDCPEEAFRVLQRDVRTWLEGLIALRDCQITQPTLVPIQVKSAVLYVPARGPFPGDRLALAEGPMRDLFLWKLHQLFIPVSTVDRLRRCPECGTIFLRIRKQQYCSRACVNRASIRKWRQTKTGKAYERKRSKTRNDARATAKTSPHVKVGRRASSGERKLEE